LFVNGHADPVRIDEIRFGEHLSQFDRIASKAAKCCDRSEKRQYTGPKTVNEELMRERLLALRDELQAAAETAEGSAAIVELDQSKVGRLSRMDAMQVQAMAQASGNRRDAALRRITAALQRIDDGEYGTCLECDEPINPKRLEFDPTVLLCIDCASKLENQ